MSSVTLDQILVPREAWTARPPTSVDSNFDASEGFVIHYTTRDAALLKNHWPDCYESWRRHQRFHLDISPIDFVDIAYNWLVCPHGFPFKGRGWHAQNGANTPLNPKTYSIAVDVDLNDPIDKAVVRTIEMLIERGIRDHGAARKVRGHSDVSSTPCPGPQLRSLLPDWIEFADSVDVTTPPSEETPPEPTQPVPGLDQVTIVGPPTVNVGQMQRWAVKHGAHIRFIQLAPVAHEESVRIGVDPSVTYGIASWESNFGKFTGVLGPRRHNWGGIKTATGGSNDDPDAHARFPSDRVGLRAVAQHAGLYGGLYLPVEDVVDPRHFDRLRNQAPSIPDDDWAWAGATHDDNVVRRVLEMRRA